MKTNMLILIHLAIAFGVTRIPFLRVYFSLSNRLIQEIIHIFISSFSKGEASYKIDLKKSEKDTGFKQGIITYLSLTCTLFVAVGLFYLVAKGSYHFILYSFILFISLSLLFWIRSFVGFMWALSFVILLAVPMYYWHELGIMHVSIFLSSFLLVHTLTNALGIILTSFKDGKNTKVLSKLARIPSVLLGILLVAQSLIAIFFIANNILDYNLAVIRFELLNTIQVVERLFSNYI
nr:M50 family metallopeptidase [Neobacillus sp. Marseille-Q6967]